MNNKGSSGQQFVILLLMSMAAAWLFFGQKDQQQGQKRQVRLPYSLRAAFIGLDSTQGSLLTKAQADAEIAALRKEIETNNQDPFSYWARLRIGLVQQYIYGKVETKPRPASLFGTLFNKSTDYSVFDEVIEHGGHSRLVTQATLQESAWTWDQQQAKDGQPSEKAASLLEQMLTRARSAPAILDTMVIVPAGDAPLSSKLPTKGFREVKLNEVRQPILERVDAYYSTTLLYKILDFGVRLCGSHKNYSYGLALILFAFVTRLLMQPLNKKQYDSMKGMQVIAPEMKKIQERYKGKSDQQSQMQMMKEVKQLQQQHGVNPMLGCGLMVVQLPIFFVIVSPMIQHYEAKMELMHASFLWVANLAAPNLPLLIIYGISMYLSFRLSTTPPADDMQRQQQMMMSVIFPVMMPFMLQGWPSAFIMYWMTFNFLSMIFQWRMMKAADPTKDIVKTLFASPFAPVSPAAGGTATASDAKTTGGAKAIGGKSGAADKASDKSGNGAKGSGGAANRNGSAIPPRPSRSNPSESNGSNGSAPKASRRSDASTPTEPEVLPPDPGDDTDASASSDGKGGPQRSKTGNRQRARSRRRF